MASNDVDGPPDVEGSWSPRRPKASGGKAAKSDKGSSPDPEALAQEIEQTREELAETLDAIADRVSPKKVATRTKKAAKAGVADAVDAVKETAASAAEAVKATAGSAAGAVKDKASDVPLEPAPTTGALADAAATTREPAGAETPYVSTLPPAEPSRVPVLAGAAAVGLVLLYLLKRRRR